MPPQNTLLPQNRIIKIGILLLPVLVILIVLIMFLRPNPDVKEMKLTSTDLVKDQHFSYIEGSSLYFYNGSGFFAANLEESGIKELHSGTKLPEPETVHWANSRGALMNFDSSFLYTAVEESLDKKGLSVNDDTRDYTWYFDLKDGSLHLVNELPIRSEAVAFSGDSSGFYYIPDYSRFRQLEDAEKSPDTRPLHFYDINSHEDKVVIDDLNVTAISALQPCDYNGFEACIVARNPQQTAETQLIGINGDTQEILHSIRGSIFPTNDPDLFLLAEQDTEAQEDNIEYVDAEQRPAVLHNIQDGSQTELGIDISNANVYPYFDGKGNFAIIDQMFFDDPESDEYYQYIAGKIDDGKARTDTLPLQYREGEYLTNRVISMSGFSDNHLLLETRGNQQLLFGPESMEGELTRIDEGSAKNIVENCATAHGDDSRFLNESQQFRIFFEENNDLKQNMRNFTKCVYNQNPKLHIGYTFRFEIVSSFNGRIISD